MVQRCLVIALLCGLLIGCGSGRPPLAAIKGTVTYNDKPLEEGDVVFYPEAGRAAVGKVIDGEIVQVSTFDPNDGAPVGELKVTVTSFPATEDMYAAKKNRVPKKYSNVKTSNLSVTVEARGDNEFELPLKD